MQPPFGKRGLRHVWLRCRSLPPKVRAYFQAEEVWLQGEDCRKAFAGRTAMECESAALISQVILCWYRRVV
ncbi:MAG: hypothetical protein EA399_11185 [Desulfovibrionales bacterium]|nr:MAG: hypothetical protein EA399_11185 [Desulfovibrionales bacterium]